MAGGTRVGRPGFGKVTMAGKTLLESQCVRMSTGKVFDGVFSALQNFNINTEAVAYPRGQTES